MADNNIFNRHFTELPTSDELDEAVEENQEGGWPATHESWREGADWVKGIAEEVLENKQKRIDHLEIELETTTNNLLVAKMTINELEAKVNQKY